MGDPMWIDELQRDVAGHAGTGEWLPITQELVDGFDVLTGHPHWLHLDKEKAKSESPFGAPVAPAFLTLSLLPLLFPGNEIERGTRLALNYGFDRVRFTAPVLVGDEIRLAVRSGMVTRQGSGAEIAYDVVVEAKSTGAVVLSAQWIVKVYHRRPGAVGVLQA